MTWKTCLFVLVVATLLMPAAQAGNLWLTEYELRIDGVQFGCQFNNITCPPPTLPGNVSSSIDPLTGLGTLTVTVAATGPSTHTISSFFDIWIESENSSFFDEFGQKIGTLPTGPSALSWEIDEPGLVFGDIKTNFQNDQLDNSASIFPDYADDASMALGWYVPMVAGQTATVTFTMGTSIPQTALYLHQWDSVEPNNVYFSSTLNLTAPPPVDNQVPEPSTWLAMLGGFGALAFRKFRS